VPRISLESRPRAPGAELEGPQAVRVKAQWTRQPPLLSAQRQVEAQRGELELEQSAALSPRAAPASAPAWLRAEPAVESLKVQAAS
jgi:hypothetical protein